MQKRHSDRKLYYQEQARTMEQHVIPFIESVRPLEGNARILEIGCGEAGNLLPFLDKGYYCTGVDLAANRIGNAEKFYADHPRRKNLNLIVANIFGAESLLPEPFDLIFMRDVIEHIPDQERFMGFVKRFLKPNGLFFLGFPPWQMPFGGHQQVLQHKWLSKVPYFHLLPSKLYRTILEKAEESPNKVNELMELKETGISIDRFDRIIRKEGFHVLRKQLYLIQPNYETKFGLKPRKQVALISSIPGVRNFFTSAAYYLLAFNERNP